MKGTRYVTLKRDFAEFIANDPVSIKHYNWVNDMMSGDESFFSTLATIKVLENGTILQDLNTNTTQGQVSTEVSMRIVKFALRSFPDIQTSLVQCS